MKRGIGLLVVCMSALPYLQAQISEATPAEKHELAEAIKEANTSGYDIIRALEAHLRKYPATPLRPDIYNLLAKAALEIRDEPRIIRYGEPALVAIPNDVTLLDRLSRALRESATTTRYAGCFFAPTRVRRIRTAMGLVLPPVTGLGNLT